MTLQACRVLVVGAGDLGMRIALRLVARPDIGDLVLTARDPAVGAARTRFIAGCGPAPTHFAALDALDSAAVADVIERVQPQLIVQCVSLHSPWLLSGRDDAAAGAFRAAGFASQLPAQLPALIAVMQAVRATGFDGAVVNCSFPDVTHAVLHGLGLAPTIGIGNAGMIHLLAQAALRARGDTHRLRTLAHHAHVSMVAGSTLAAVPVAQRPRLFVDDGEIPAATLFADAPAIPLTRELNDITAAHAQQVIAAYLGLSADLHTAAPGVAGLPGGWPVTVSKGAIEFDPPAGIDHAAMLAFNRDMARMDGVERIDADGTVHFTDALRAALAPHWPALAEPLAPLQAESRYAQLRLALGPVTAAPATGHA